MFLTPVAVVGPSFHCADLLIGRRAFSQLHAVLMCKFTYPDLVHVKNLICPHIHMSPSQSFSIFSCEYNCDVWYYQWTWILEWLQGDFQLFNMWQQQRYSVKSWRKWEILTVENARVIRSEVCIQLNRSHNMVLRSNLSEWQTKKLNDLKADDSMLICPANKGKALVVEARDT